LRGGGRWTVFVTRFPSTRRVVAESLTRFPIRGHGSSGSPTFPVQTKAKPTTDTDRSVLRNTRERNRCSLNGRKRTKTVRATDDTRRRIGDLVARLRRKCAPVHSRGTRGAAAPTHGLCGSRRTYKWSRAPETVVHSRPTRHAAPRDQPDLTVVAHTVARRRVPLPFCRLVIVLNAKPRLLTSQRPRRFFPFSPSTVRVKSSRFAGFAVPRPKQVRRHTRTSIDIITRRVRFFLWRYFSRLKQFVNGWNVIPFIRHHVQCSFFTRQNIDVIRAYVIFCSYDNTISRI